MRQAYRLGETFVEAEPFCDGPSYLRHLDAVGESCPVVVIQAGSEDLSLAFETAEGRAVYYSVAITLEIRPIRMRFFRVDSTPAVFRRYCITTKIFGHFISRLY